MVVWIKVTTLKTHMEVATVTVALQGWEFGGTSDTYFSTFLKMQNWVDVVHRSTWHSGYLREVFPLLSGYTTATPSPFLGRGMSGLKEKFNSCYILALLYSGCVCVCECVCVCHSVESDSLSPLWAVALQALLSMEFSRQEYWSRVPFSSPRDLPDLGIETGSPAL